MVFGRNKYCNIWNSFVVVYWFVLERVFNFFVKLIGNVCFGILNIYVE